MSSHTERKTDEEGRKRGVRVDITLTSEPDETRLFIDDTRGRARQLIHWLGVPRELLGGGGGGGGGGRAHRAGRRSTTCTAQGSGWHKVEETLS